MIKNAIAYITRKRNRTLIIFIILTIVLSCLYSCLTIMKSSDEIEKALYESSNSSISITRKDGNYFNVNEFKDIEKLKEIDPVSYETIHENNIKRVIRALEFYHQNHTPISAHNEKEHQKTSPYRFAYFVLTDEREKLYRRIDQRVDLMMEQGLLTEVKTLYDMGCRKDMVSMQGLGYKEILDYLDGSCSLEEAVYVIKRETRHFAKRQLTWFRREKDVIWLDKSEFNDREDQMLQKMTDVLHEKGIIQ